MEPASPAPDVAAETEVEVVTPPAPQTVHAWLAQARPAGVLALLREPDFAHINVIAFAGFRVSAQSYAMPMVRGRLAQEAVKNNKFAEKLQALAASVAAQPEVTTPLSPPPSNPLADRRDAERELLRAERERVKALRAERDAARQEVAAADTARQQATQTQQEAEVARTDAERLAQEQARETARLKRRITRLQEEVATLTAERESLQKTLKQSLLPSPSLPAPTPEEKADLPASPWQTAAAHLLNRRKPDAVLILAEEVLRLAPDDSAALALAAQACEARHELPQAAAFVRRLLDHAIAHNRTTDAADAWLWLVRLTTPAHAEKPLRAFLRILRPNDSAGIRQMRLALTRLHGLAPAAHAQAVQQITHLTTPALAEALMPPPGALGPDDALPLGLLFPPSAQELLAAVRAGDEPAVAAARDALAHLQAERPEEFARVRAALEQAAGDELPELQPLLRTPRGPVVVDASNVALHGQEMLANPRPRLRALQAMRRTLLTRGFFPILAVADANLPHTIDEPAAFAALRARREIRLVDAGTAADEALLREAKRLSAPLITNDYMTDWDPQQQVTKIRFTFSHTGDALFDS